MSWRERADPTVVRMLWGQIHRRFSPEAGWGLDDFDGVSMTMALLAARRPYWDLHAFAIGYWASSDIPPSSLIHALAKGDEDVIPGFMRYVYSPWPDVGLKKPSEKEIRASAVFLYWAIDHLENFDGAVSRTIESMDPAVDDCFVQFPDDGDEFYECVKRATQ